MEKINVAELLRNCPKDMELNCMMYEDVYFDYVDELNIIHCYIQNEGFKTSITFNQHGTPNSDVKSKCVIFPKGKMSWAGFVPPCQFKDGDIITSVKESNPFIFHYDNGEFYDVHCALINDYLQIYKRKNNWVSNRREFRYATEEEKQKLFDAIKANGYKWNIKTKTLEKLIVPNFKVGDRIRPKSGYSPAGAIIGIDANCYQLENLTYVLIEGQDKWELDPSKFDINTLKPFDKVLVRDYDNKVWKTQFFERLNNRLKDKFICMGGNRYHQCVPYEGNEYLLNYSNKPKDFYINWE